MARVHDEDCPFEPASRANRCSSCCDASNSLTPCVVAWLRDQVSERRGGFMVVPVDAEARSSRRAA